MEKRGLFITRDNSNLYSLSNQINQQILNIGVIFGGQSPEHEVSVITALQVVAALDKQRYRAIPIYISKDGVWFTGPDLLNLETFKDLDTLPLISSQVHLQKSARSGVSLVADVPKKWFGKQILHIPLHMMFIALHGGEGENGGVQGICETYNIPYCGSGVLGSSLGMDKVVSKMVCRDQTIPIVDYISMHEYEWEGREEQYLNECEKLGYPLIVKPARLGSSIGIARATDRSELDAAIEDAFRYDDKVVVEYAVPELREINCSVLGDVREARASVLEEPLTGEELLSFQEKYMRNDGDSGSKGGGTKESQSSAGMASLDRVIPAPLSDKQTKEIQDLAVRVFQLFECAGVARIDFLMNGETGEVYFNEINTIPGSFSFYLWEPSGVSFPDLVSELIQMAFKKQKEKMKYVRTYDTNLLAVRASGSKGAKS